MRHRRRWALVGVAAFIVIVQLIPYGRAHSNPPVAAEPAWDSPRTRELAERACFACHSNQTTWPWYSNIAPVSWYVQHDVNEGRSKLNFSEWNRRQEDANEAGEAVAEGEMPPGPFTWLHREAKLNPEERDALTRGLNATLGTKQRGRD